MSTSPVREDAQGPYVRTGGYVFRPGAIRGYEHALRMDVAGLTAGSRVKARHKGGTPLAKLLLEDGSTTYWAEEETSGKDAVIAPQEATWLKNGRRDTRRPGVADTTINDQLPRQIEVVTQSDCTGPRLWI